MDQINESHPIYIVSNYGTIQKSTLSIFRKEVNLEASLIWRCTTNSTYELSCKLSFIKSIATDLYDNSEYLRYFSRRNKEPIDKLSRFELPKIPQIHLFFPDFKLTIELCVLEETQRIFELLTDLHFRAMKIHTFEKDYNTKISHQQQQQHSRLTNLPNLLPTLQQQDAFARQQEYECNVKQEQLLQMSYSARMKDGIVALENFRSRFHLQLLGGIFHHWVKSIRDQNENKMLEDRHRWRLHAASNQDIDLQAWYHALFYQEVYRLRGHFWYKDALLPSYRHSYDLVDNGLTPLEEAALAHVLCSPDTTYGDVAGQMFIVQAILPDRQFKVFQQLAAQGTTIIKYPRTGRPAKKHFRFSFVEGNIYLTWKGKFGNQGVGMGEITNLMKGIQTDILKWSAQTSKSNQYLSIICSDRSIDLFFDTEEERDHVHDVLMALVAKEQGNLYNVEDALAELNAPQDDFDKVILYSSIAKKFF